MAQSTVSGLIGEETDWRSGCFAVETFKWFDRFRFSKIFYDGRDEAVDYAMDLEYIQGIACYVVRGA